MSENKQDDGSMDVFKEYIKKLNTEGWGIKIRKELEQEEKDKEIYWDTYKYQRIIPSAPATQKVKKAQPVDTVQDVDFED